MTYFSLTLDLSANELILIHTLDKLINFCITLDKDQIAIIILGFDIVIITTLIYFSGKKAGEKIVDGLIKGLQIGAATTVIATGINTGFGTKLKPQEEGSSPKLENTPPSPSAEGQLGESNNNSKASSVENGSK